MLSVPMLMAGAALALSAAALTIYLIVYAKARHRSSLVLAALSAVVLIISILLFLDTLEMLVDIGLDQSVVASGAVLLAALAILLAGLLRGKAHG
jgi:hypothetical protein